MSFMRTLRITSKYPRHSPFLWAWCRVLQFGHGGQVPPDSGGLRFLQLLLKCFSGFTIFTPIQIFFILKRCWLLIPPLQCLRLSISPLDKVLHLLPKNQVVSVVFNTASVLHTTWHTYNNKERDTTTLAFIPLMLLALIGWRTHDQTVLYNWRVAKYARHAIFNRDELTRTEEAVRICEEVKTDR